MNHKRHPVVFLIPVLLFGTLITTNLLGCNSAPPPAATTTESEAFPPVKADVLKQLFPDTVGQGKPVVVDFYSKFCLGCQALSPKLEAAVKKHPGVTLQTIDIQKNDPKIKEISQTLGAVTAPYVLFINGEGTIKAMFLEDVPQAEVDAAFQSVEK